MLYLNNLSRRKSAEISEDSHHSASIGSADGECDEAFSLKKKYAKNGLIESQAQNKYSNGHTLDIEQLMHHHSNGIDVDSNSLQVWTIYYTIINIYGFIWAHRTTTKQTKNSISICKFLLKEKDEYKFEW
jgi:hypothetical protein